MELNLNQTYDFIYAVRPSAVLTEAMQQLQLSSKDTPAGQQYAIDPMLKSELILASLLPDPYEPLYVGISLIEEVAGKVFFNVYQIPNGKLTVVPRITMELADTQFSDVTQEVSPARTIMGALFNAFENVESPAFDHNNAFKVIDTTLVFGFTVKTLTETPNQQPFKVVGYNESIGRVSMDELIDDMDNYDEVSLQFVQHLAASKEKEQ
jgi:hypothetical protein